MNKIQHPESQKYRNSVPKRQDLFNKLPNIMIHDPVTNSCLITYQLTLNT